MEITVAYGKSVPCLGGVTTRDHRVKGRYANHWAAAAGNLPFIIIIISYNLLLTISVAYRVAVSVDVEMEV